jgi:hypothetical protein
VQSRDYVLERHGPEGVESIKAALNEETHAIDLHRAARCDRLGRMSAMVSRTWPTMERWATVTVAASAQMCRELYDWRVTKIYRRLVTSATPRATAVSLRR